MRVCHIISGDLWAGAEVAAARLLEGLARLPGVEPATILLNEGKLAGEIRRLGIPLTVLDEGAYSFPALARTVRALVRGAHPDVVHAHRYKENLLAWGAVSGPVRPRLVATQHGMPEEHRGSSPWRQRLLAGGNFRLLSRFFDCVVAVSEDIRDRFVSRYRFPPDKVRVVRNGVVIPAASGTRDRRDRPVIGSCGRFFPVKEYPLMVEIARAIVDAQPGTRFELAGDGPGREEIEIRIRRLGLQDRFLIRGFLDEVDGFYGGLSLYLNTSSHEGIPMSVLEAMARGVPVVAPNVGGLREIVRDGLEGFLVGDRDPISFAEPCLRLLQDPALRERMGAAARERVAKEFTVEVMARGYLEAYRDVLH